MNTARWNSKNIRQSSQLNVNEDSLVMIVDRSDENVYQGVLELKEKLDQTFQECRKVIRERTPYRIAQREILIQPYNGLFLGSGRDGQNWPYR